MSRSVDDLPYIRMNGSLADYDGDGDTLEGIGEEIQGLQELALEAMQAYATEVSGTAHRLQRRTAIRTSSSIPTATAKWMTTKRPPTTASRRSRRRCWKPPTTIRFPIKDPGAFAHNPKYIIELLYNSIDSLNASLQDPIDLSDGQPRRRGTLQHHRRTLPSLGCSEAKSRRPARAATRRADCPSISKTA